MSDKTRSRYAVIAILLITITGLTIIDLIFDWPHALSLSHFVVEIAIVLVCFTLSVYLILLWLAERRQAMDANDSLHTHRQGLGSRIDQQLKDWRLTRAEYNTAVLMIKGLSHKEIAAICGRGERTVRQHAVAVYRKSGLGGRAQLSAFFLEDLLPPVEPEPSKEA
ncbi:MAG: helix-turn-helix transcriptional regulator [Thiohalomonadaceae bacterium]